MVFSLQYDAISRTIRWHHTCCMLPGAWFGDIAHYPATSHVMPWPRRRRSCAWCSGVAYDVRASLTTQRPRAINEAVSNHKRDNRPLQPPTAFAEYFRNQCCRSALVSMWIRIKEAKQMQIHVDSDPDPGQTLKSQKVNFYMKNRLKVVKSSKNILTKVAHPFWQQKSRFPC
jgi:hypothetical protein